MALQVYTSTDHHSLANQLAEEVTKIKDVFQKHFIVRGHTSIDTFLTQEIADKNGIAANIEYKPALDFVEMVYSILEAGLRKNELFKAQQLVWLIDEVLSDKTILSKSEFEKIKTYIGDDSQKRFTLAEQIANLFQSYQSETPEIIKTWNKNSTYSSVKAEDEAWQRIIWQAIDGKLAGKLPDLTKVYALISEKLQTAEGQQLIKEKLPSVSFYGNLPYSPSLIQLLKELGEYIDVTLFYVSFSGKSDYRLVENFGQLSKKQHDLLAEFDAEEVEGNQVHEENMLGELQKRIKGESTISEKIKADDSITIANSFTVSREVEALYHYLVSQFENNKALMMREICVIIPDVDTYAPAINAYFTNSAFKINYSLYDTSHKIHASPYAAIEALLRTEKDEFTSKKVMSLLDFDFIRNKFGIDEDLSVLTQAVKLANIRHSIDGDKENETEYVSWRYGLKRLIYGFCLSPEMYEYEVEFADTSFYPVVEFEGRDTVEIMRLDTFVEQLNEWLELRNQERTLNEWIDFIAEDTVEQFIDFKEYDRNLLTGILRALGDTSAYYSLKVPYKVMRYYLLNHLGQFKSGEQKGHGGVSFVSPNTYLSNPVKIFAFLGMNSADFPRNSSQLSFDLNDEQRVTKNEEDKNLLLNTLLLSKEKVYYSYLGQDIRSNSEIPASTVLDELKAALSEFVIDFDPKKFEVKHPLHAFNKRYNSEEGLKMYNEKDKGTTIEVIKKPDKSAKKTDKKEVELPEENGKKVIQLSDLIRFMEDPVKHYFNKVLEVYFSDREIELDEVEPFELDSLESWGVKDKIVRNGIAKEPVESLKEQFKKMGKLPLSEFGSQLLEESKNEVDKILSNQHISELLSKNTTDLSEDQVEIDLGEYLLKGKIDNVFGDTLLLATPSRDKVKYKIRAMMNFYFASLENKSLQQLFYIAKNKNSDKDNFVLYSSENQEYDKTKKVLTEWCESYEKGTKNLIYFTSAFADKINSKHSKDIDENYPNKLNSEIDKGINPIYEKGGVFASQPFKIIAKNDGFKDPKKASSFLAMHEAIQELTKNLTRKK